MASSTNHLSKERWEQLEPYQRWLYLLHREGSEPRSRTLLLSRSSQVHLVSRNLSPEMVLMHVDGRMPTSMEFFRKYCESILVELPFVHWKEVFQVAGHELLPFRQAGVRHLKQLAAHWVDMLSGDEKAARNFIRWLCDCLLWKSGGTLELESWELPLVSVNMEAVTLSSEIPMHVTILSKDHPESIAANEIRSLRELLSRRDRSSLIVNIVVGNRQSVSDYRANLEASDIDEELVILDEIRIKRIFLSQRYSQTVRAVLQEDLGLLRMNPYSTEGPVPRSNMFFGRHQEIDEVIHHPERDFMIIGSRQIGKSSLCKQVQRNLSHENCRTFWVDASQYQSADEFFTKLALEINEHRSVSMSVRRFPQMVRSASSACGCKFVFLIDEIDRLLHAAAQGADWRVFQVLRELSQDQLAQTLFTGHRTLYEQYRNLESPLYNFASPIVLSRLDEKSAVRLIKEPMHALGISFKASDERKIVKHIVDQTGRLPSLLQCFCHELVKQVAARAEKSRTITWEDVGAVHNRKEFRQFTLKAFGHEENLTKLEWLILLELAQGEETEFTFTRLLHVIDRHNLCEYSEELVHSLENLEIAGLIESELSSGRPWRREETDALTFRVTIPSLPTTIKKSRDVPRRIEEVVTALTLTETGRRSV